VAFLGEKSDKLESDTTVGSGDEDYFQHTRDFENFEVEAGKDL